MFKLKANSSHPVSPGLTRSHPVSPGQELVVVDDVAQNRVGQKLSPHREAVEAAQRDHPPHLMTRWSAQAKKKRKKKGVTPKQ